MKTIKDAKKQKLIKEAHKLLDQIEANLHFIVNSIKRKNAA